jgi:hypothetical protein
MKKYICRTQRREVKKKIMPRTNFNIGIIGFESAN